MKTDKEIFTEMVDEAPAVVSYVLKNWMKYFFITMSVIVIVICLGAISRWIGNTLKALMEWANGISESFGIAVFIVIAVLFITFIIAIFKAVWFGINE